MKEILHKVVFYIYVPLLFLLSLLPFKVLYLISYFLYLIVYKGFKYRKKVVFDNLRKSFPQKSQAELEIIATKYYRHLCDLIVEEIKLFTISTSSLLKRCAISGDKSILDNYFYKKQNCIGVLGHFGNWEWASPMFSNYLDFRLNVIYRKLSNTPFDKLINKVRTRFGSVLIEQQNTIKAMIQSRDITNITILIADQSPDPNNAIWLNFLNQDTPVLRGPAVLAQKFNYPLLYLSVRKPKRGYYDFHYSLLVEEPKKMTEEEIMQIFMHKLEFEINIQPELWLWSHRRWKHKR